MRLPVRIGTSFSSRQCLSLGLSGRLTFGRVLELGFGLVRISAYWDQIRSDGYGELDWLLDAARDARQPILLTVGMKAMRWPEFYIPTDLQALTRRDGRIGVDSPLAASVLGFVSETVARYRDRQEIVAWQVENEPFNRSGPQRWWIDPGMVHREIQSVRALDARPIVLNAFAHFDSDVDSRSRPRRGPFGLRRLVPEKLILNSGDVLGLDVYRSIGMRNAAHDWAEAAGRWLRAAQRRGKTAWVIESQAEPWQSSSFAPEDIVSIYEQLARAGFPTILLWGCEHWFSRAAAGDPRWLEVARGLLDPT